MITAIPFCSPVTALHELSSSLWLMTSYLCAAMYFLAASLDNTIESKRVLIQTCRQSHLSVGLSVCLSGCGLGWWVESVENGYIRWVEGKGAVLGGKCGTSHCNSWNSCYFYCWIVGYSLYIGWWLSIVMQQEPVAYTMTTCVVLTHCLTNKTILTLWS